VTVMFVASFGVLAFIIAMVGIGGLLAFSVSTRTPEFGIRMSLGADARSVRAMILAEGGMLLLGGIVTGVVAAVISTRLLRALLFGISPNYPVTLVGFVIALF